MADFDARLVTDIPAFVKGPPEGGTVSAVLLYPQTTPASDLPSSIRVQNLEPAILSTLAPGSPISFDYVDLAAELGQLLISIYNLKTSRVELVWDGEEFQEGYLSSSLVGNTFRLYRTGGWPQNRFKLRIKAIDADGNTEVIV